MSDGGYLVAVGDPFAPENLPFYVGRSRSANRMKSSDLPVDGRRRAVVEGVEPALDGGRFPIKRIVGDRVLVQADVFGDGHDAIGAALVYRKPGSAAWQRVPMQALHNDRWEATFTVEQIGQYRYTVEGWVDHFASWHRDLKKRVEAGQNIAIDLLVGAELVARAAARAAGKDATALAAWAAGLREASPIGQLCHRRGSSRWPRRSGPIAYPDLEARHALRAGTGDRPRRPTTCAVQHLVRDVSAIDKPSARQARNSGRLHRPVALRRGDGLRRPLFAANPPDRTNFPQRPQ